MLSIVTFHPSFVSQSLFLLKKYYPNYMSINDLFAPRSANYNPCRSHILFLAMNCDTYRKRNYEILSRLVDALLCIYFHSTLFYQKTQEYHLLFGLKESMKKGSQSVHVASALTGHVCHRSKKPFTTEMLQLFI